MLSKNPISLIFLIPEIYFLLHILLTIFFGLYLFKKYKKLSSKINIIFSKINIYFFILLSYLVYNVSSLKKIFYNNTLIVDPLIFFGKYFIIFCMIFILILSIKYMSDNKIRHFEFNILLLISVFGLFFLISSYDFVIFYLALEIQSLSFYILTTLKRNSAYSTEGGLKYFILGAITSGLFLFGTSLLYGFTGTTNFYHLHQLLLSFSSDLSVEIPFAVYIGFALVLFTLFFKLALAPFHIWSPDVYEGAPMIITTFFSIIPKIGFIVVFIRFVFQIFYNIIFAYDFIFIFVIVASFLISTFNALQQRKLKRFFAYSSIGHMAFILIGLSSTSLLGFQAAFIYLFFYIVTNITIWSILLSLKIYGTRAYINNFVNLANIRKAHLGLMLCFSIGLLSMAGIPPLAGFFSKFLIILSGVENHQYFVIFIAILASIISCFYYIRIIKIIFFEEMPNTKNLIIKPLTKLYSYIISISVCILLFSFFFIDFLSNFATYLFYTLF